MRIVNVLESEKFSINNAFDQTITAWAKLLEYGNYETFGHSQRVTFLSVRFAEHVGISGEEIRHFKRGALLHDCTKIVLPQAILLKPGPLSTEERRIVETHPQIAYEILSPINFLEKSISIPYSHHEKWNGTGYPRHLAGEHIPLFARIFSIVDVWDAITNKRVYKEAWSFDVSLQYLAEESGKSFDPNLVTEFLNMMSDTK